MRRLVGLIVLLALILGVAWLVRNDYHLNGIADLQTLFEPAGQGGAAKTPPKEVASAPGAEAPAAPEASQSGTEAEAPSGEPSAATVAKTEPAASEIIEPSEAPTAAEPAAPAAGGMAAAESEASEVGAPTADTDVDTAMAEPADTAEPAPADIVVPSFDIVRVEPTGETVVAGLAEPQAKVEVLDGPEPVATAEANERGEWALVLDKPLPPGSHDLAVRTTSKDRSLVTLSDQRVAVSVPENANEEPLVVLNQPDAPSQVMQIPAETAAAPTVAEASKPQQSEASPGSPPSAAETEVAAAAQSKPMTEMPSSSGEGQMAAPSEPTPPAAATEAPAAETKVAAASQPEPTTEMPPSSGEGEMAAAPEPKAPLAPMETSAPEAEVASAPTAEPSMPSGLPESAGAPSTSETAPEAAAAPAESPAIAETEVAASPAAEATPDTSGKSEVAAPSSSPSAEAGTETMAAESKASTQTMTADATATGSEQPASAQPTTAPAGTGEKVGEASSAPEPPTPTEMADVPSVVQEEPAAAETATVKQAEVPTSAEPESPAVAEEPPIVPKVGVTAVEAETNGTLYIAGTATTPEPVRVYVDDEFLGEATPAESGTWLLETTREMAPDEYTIRADQVEAGSGQVVARAEVPFEREIDVATLKPVGESVNASTAEVSGSVAGPMQVIIKRGDNLWRISREMYGHGIRYSTIYRANRDQIRNPNLIYPGQVFVLPAGDASWQN